MNVSRVVCLALLLVFITPFASAQTNAPVHLAHHDPSTLQGMEGGLWRTDHDFESVLYLKNVLINQALTATPTVYMADGTSFDLQSITLDPAGVASVNIGRAIQALPPALQGHRSTFGTLGIRYQWSWAGAVLATVRNVDEVAMVSFESSLMSDTNVAHAVASTGAAQRLEGPWWKATPDSTGFIVLSNSLLKSLPITIIGNDANGAAKSSKQVVLPPHASEWVSLADVLGAEPRVGDSGNLQIRYSGPDQSLHVTGGMEDDKTGYSATLHLQELHPEKARNPNQHALTLDAPGLMYGLPDPKMHFPQDTFFQLYTVLHNTSSQQRDISVAVSYSGTGGPETHTLGSVSLAPHTTQAVDVPALMRSAKVAPTARSVSLSLSFTGNESDIQSEVGSVDGSMNYVFAIYVQREEWTIGRTLCHWTLLGDSNTMISLWNYTDKAEDLQLTLYYRNGQYVIPVHLDPRADYELDLATLVNSRKPDATGTVIPSNITEGSAILTDVQGEGTKISVATSSGEFNVRNATCGQNCQTCNGLSSISLITQPFSLSIGGSMQTYANITYNTNSTTTTTSGAWSSTTSAVTVDTKGMIYAGGVGSGYITDTTSAPPYLSYTCFGYNGGCPGPSNFQGEGPTTSTPTVSIAGPSTITAGAAATYTLTATGNPTGGTYTFSAPASTIASLSNTSTSTTNTTQITGSGSGVVTVTVKYTLNNQSAQSSLPISVLLPNNLRVANDTSQTVACPAGNELQRQIRYTIQSGTTPITDPIYLKEGVPNPTKDSCGVTVGTGAAGFNSSSVYPGNNNQFTDYLGDCPTAQSSCSYSFPNQQWLDLSPSGTIATIGPVNATSTSVTVNGNSTNFAIGTDFKP